MKTHSNSSRQVFFVFAICFMFVAGANAQSGEDFWSMHVGNSWDYNVGSSETVRIEITGTDSISGNTTYRVERSENGRHMRTTWFSISDTEVKDWKEMFFNDELGDWATVTIDTGLTWLNRSMMPVDVESSGTFSIAAGGGDFPITVSMKVTLLGNELVTVPFGTYDAYKVQRIITLLNSPQGDMKLTEYHWVVPYLGVIKWQQEDITTDTGILSSMNIYTVFADPNLLNWAWAYQYIMAIYEDGITVGCAQDDPNTSENEKRYCPEDSVTREQMAAFLVRAVEGEPPLDYCTVAPFPDVTPDMWSCKYIKKLRELGITTGYQGGTYGPYDLVPREQMAAFIVRAVEGEPAADYCDSGTAFPDVTSTMWSCKYIKRLKELNITTGYQDGTYGPYDLVTRAQMAAFLSRAFLGMQ